MKRLARGVSHLGVIALALVALAVSTVVWLGEELLALRERLRRPAPSYELRPSNSRELSPELESAEVMAEKLSWGDD